ncbi:hypothetical protein BIWAKO_06046 [Bosea sp. BIWAKO-01]|nr:hypothetical protein BIWAKO_06046 [Bosea sp. BIWAKO-01]
MHEKASRSDGLDGNITHVVPMPVEAVGPNVTGFEDGLDAVGWLNHRATQQKRSGR